MKKLMYIRNNKGLTITELLIAIALSSIVGLGVFQVLNDNNSLQKMFSEKMDERIEANLADKLILRDLRAAGPSLNNLKFNDDKNLNFYDFEADRSTAFYRSQTQISRTVTLKKGGNTIMYFLSFDDLRGKGLFADAVTFFEVGPPPANIYQPASLTYRGINYNNYLTAKDSNGNDMNNPQLIHPTNLNKLVLVDSSSYMPTVPARPAVFIGKVVNTGGIYDIQRIPATSIPNNSSNTDIWDYRITTPTKTIVDPANFIQYMYNLPPVGANGASVRIKPVRLYKYELDCADPANCIFYRHDVLHGISTQKVPLMRGFNCVRFTRDDIATSIFQVITDKNLCSNIK
ncbi:MAG: prepilin-type N-terminal cleavage/methylation domain-containing protein [Pseudobdellovibrio sp.]|nr:prepilin-type N-terminal cleavage/methylation domain-containing protein [Pseudobdellovibrio sp.]